MSENNLWVIRQQFAQCVFNNKIHEISTERNDKYMFYIKLWNIIIVSAILITIILQLIYENNIFISGLSIWLSIWEIIFLIIQLFFNFWDKSSKHKNSALKFLWLRDRYKNFISGLHNGYILKKEESFRIESLQNEYQIICEISPQTTDKDFEKAQKDLLWKNNKWEEYTWSNKEINRFLPKDLHI